MKQLKNISLKTPVLFSIMIVLAGTILTCSIPLNRLFLLYATEQIAGFLEGIILQTVVGILLVVLSIKLGNSIICGYKETKYWKKIWVYWPIIILILLQSTNIFDSNMKFDTAHPIKILLFVVVYLTTGLFEEALTRGLVLPVMLQRWGNSKRGIYQSVFLSSLLFGFLHIYSYIIGRLTLLGCLNQIIYAFLIGAFFAACVIRTKSIWFGMLMHGIFDIVFSLNEITIGWKPTISTATFASIMGTLILFIPFFLYALFILRKESQCAGQ